jgi:hypothetical protein
MTTINLSMLPGGLMKDLQFQNASILPDTRTDILSTPFSILPEEVVMKLSPQGGSLQGFLGACSQVGGWEKEKSEPMREVARLQVLKESTKDIQQGECQRHLWSAVTVS